MVQLATRKEQLFADAARAVDVLKQTRLVLAVALDEIEGQDELNKIADSIVWEAGFLLQMGLECKVPPGPLADES